VLDREIVGREPGVEMRRLAGTDLVTERRAEEAIQEDQASIGGEHQVRQAGLWRHQLDHDPELAERFI